VLERSDQSGSEGLRARLTYLPPAEVVTTIISHEAQMRGWMAYRARMRSVAHQVEAYRLLLQYLDNYRRIPVLACDEAAAVAFQQLRSARLRNIAVEQQDRLIGHFSPGGRTKVELS
jgi:hypothetical protein